MGVAERFLSVSPKLSLKRSVYDSWIRRAPGMGKLAAAAYIAAEFDISVSTVQRYVRELKTYGDGGAPKCRTQGRKLFAWDDAALAFMRSFYLAARREAGGCTARNAYRRTAEEAQKHGWRIGSESSAYKYLSNLSPVLIEYASGGNRALDNKFWILRDLRLLRPFQIVVGDQHRFDFWCEDENGKLFRPECYLWLDMRTRLVYGLAFDRHYTASTVIRALRVGVEHFGRFECTYNDNGTAERSAWTDLVVEQLQTYGMRWGDDIANLYKDDESGMYTVRDDEGSIVAYAKDRAEWYEKNRRIFAQVKNAKTKPIERFFSTLEQLLRDQCLPGYVKELNLSAPEEEEAARRLAWQKKNGYMLSFSEFILAVARAVDQYNNRRHSSLGRSPVEELELARRNGWRQTFLNPADIEYLFFNRTYAVVNGDRIRLNGKYFAGPPLTQEMVLHNRGSLINLNKKRVEVRYNPDNLDAGVYAIDPRTKEAIVLHQVQAIDMFDADAFHREIQLKRQQIKAASEAFREAAGSRRVLIDNSVSRPYVKSETLAAAIPAYALPTDAAQETEPELAQTEKIAVKISREIKQRPQYQAVYTSERERYTALLKAQHAGTRISDADQEFMLSYEERMDDDDLLYISNVMRALHAEEAQA
ncbi:MAG TPA: hypothetical protein IAA30_08920 [Candidatus Treponema faecavium]|nr:hypothetical protein [Candidatus Treponema faecavium]